ncbi:uncharacterized protein LOC114323481 [Camellia sinensis]|uniref:uncharacterized protein LOC114323481 n=1 Tax=Camellia sinensis TaxID=4442 RepID=UPI0010365B5F|nr:uncharacterized protein LOC114323481 [Camellia sinensis]
MSELVARTGRHHQRYHAGFRLIARMLTCLLRLKCFFGRSHKKLNTNDFFKGGDRVASCYYNGVLCVKRQRKLGTFGGVWCVLFFGLFGLKEMPKSLKIRL